MGRSGGRASARGMDRRAFLKAVGLGAAALAGSSQWGLLAGGSDAPLRPADADASTDASAVLAYLSGLSRRADKRVVSGQFAGHCEDVGWGFEHWVRPVHAATGKWPAMIGADYGWYQGKTADPDLVKTNEPLIAHWRRGGLVALSWHARNPWTGGTAWDRSKVGDLRDLVAGRSEAGRGWQRELDMVAGGLAELRDAGVVVLWRPFHEMNGAWFWWGGAEPEDFAALWRHMFECFTDDKQLDNLLWVYGANVRNYASIGPEDAHYPGGSYADVVGLDVYADTLGIKSYDRLVAFGKPFGLTEYGPGEAAAARKDYDYERLIEQIRAGYPAVCFFLCWAGGGLRDWSLAAQKNAAGLLNDRWVVTLAELDWRQAGTVSAHAEGDDAR